MREKRISKAVLQTVVLGGGSSPTYMDTVKTLFGAGLIQYFPMYETSGTVANDESIENNDGAYTAVTLANAVDFDNRLVPLFVPANSSRVNCYSAALNTDFNGQEGTVMIWFKARDASIWTDGAQRRFWYIAADADNFIEIYKRTTNNSLLWQYKAGGTSKAATIDAFSPTGWTQLLMTWSLTSDAVKVYVNGVQQGATATGLGTWAGNLASSSVVLSAPNTSGGHTWDGWLAHYALGKAAL